MVMWLLSDRALPRSFSMMQGFGVHTFRLINAAGTSRFVKFHWKPKLGVHSLVFDEASKISGKDPDFHRRSLWNDINAGNFPEWELGLQIVEEADQYKFDFDLLDATKLIPEELVPVMPVGKLVLNRNPDNYFAETEQVGAVLALRYLLSTSCGQCGNSLIVLSAHSIKRPFFKFRRPLDYRKFAFWTDI